MDMFKLTPTEEKFFRRKIEGKVFLFDQDDTLCDWSGNFHKNLGELHPHLEIPEHGKRSPFELFETIPNVTQEAIQEVFHLDGSYRNLEPYKDVQKALNTFEYLGMEGYICTSPIYTNYSCASDKIAWMYENISSFWGNRTIITKDKTLVHGDYLFDDKQNIQGLRTPSWEQIVFDQPYNQSLNTHKRLTNWSNWKELFEAL